jgi:hypothetical protein
MPEKKEAFMNYLHIILFMLLMNIAFTEDKTDNEENPSKLKKIWEKQIFFSFQDTPFSSSEYSLGYIYDEQFENKRFVQLEVVQPDSLPNQKVPFIKSISLGWGLKY